MSIVPSNYLPSTIRGIHISLMDLFNNIRVRDYSSSDTSGTIVDEIRVPIQLSMQEKYQSYLKEAESGQKYYPKYPKMSLTWSSINYNGERSRGVNVKRYWKTPSTGFTDVDSYISDVQPIPYDLGFELDIQTQSMSHFTQIIESILPYFNPARHIRIKEFRFLNVERDIKVKLEGVSQEFLIEQEDSVRRYVNGTLQLTVEAFIYEPFETDIGMIKEIRSRYVMGPQASGFSALDGFNTSGWDSSANFPITSGTYESTILGTGANQLNLPTGVCLDNNNYLYVSDFGNDRILKFDSAGEFLNKWGSTGSGNGQFNDPTLLQFINNNIYVTDGSNNRIQIFDVNGNYLLQFGTSGTSAGQFDFPSGIAADSDNNLYVTDFYNDRIQVFNVSGTFIREWGSNGTSAGQFTFPSAISINSNDIVYVADTYNDRIQVFDLSGTFIREWGTSGTSAGQFDKPFDIIVDSKDRIIVPDYYNDRVQIFDSDGTFMAEFGRNGSENGEFIFPAGIGVDSNNKIYVTDSNNRVQKFAISVPYDTSGTFVGANSATFEYYVDSVFD